MTRKEQARNGLMIWGKKFYDTWFDLQLIHFGGKYSIERMLALEEYTRNTSLTRVLFLSIGLPLLIVALVLCQESVPLQDPADGWKANYGFWVRVALVGAAIAQAVANKVEPWLEVPSLSFRQIFAYCSIVGLGLAGVGVVIAEIWVFPIPFFMLILSSPVTLLIIGGLRAVAGACTFRLITSQIGLRRRMNLVSGLQALMGTAYPAYQALFTKVNHTNYELPVILLLPIFKLITKAILAHAASHKQDMIPEQVVFTVDFFDAFYLATFMQTLSTSTLVVVLVVDLLQTAIEMQELHQRTRGMIDQLHKIAGTTADTHGGGLLTNLKALSSKPDVLRKQMRSKIEVRSCIFHKLSHEGRILLEKVVNESRAGSSTSISPFQSPQVSARVLSRSASLVKSSRRSSSSRWFRHGSRNVIAVQPLPALGIPSAPTMSKSIVHDKQTTLSIKSAGALQEALEVLFASECIVLTEYVEVFVPIIYGAFILVMVHLPSAKYHTEMMGVTNENANSMVSRMFVYALLEFFSFVILAVVTKRICGIQIIYQLAFVLETQMASVLTKVMLWLLVTLTYRVVHFGVDFTFRFDWMA